MNNHDRLLSRDKGVTGSQGRIYSQTAITGCRPQETKNATALYSRHCGSSEWTSWGAASRPWSPAWSRSLCSAWRRHANGKAEPTGPQSHCSNIDENRGEPAFCAVCSLTSRPLSPVRAKPLGKCDRNKPAINTERPRVITIKQLWLLYIYVNRGCVITCRARKIWRRRVFIEKRCLARIGGGRPEGEEGDWSTCVEGLCNENSASPKIKSIMPSFPRLLFRHAFCGLGLELIRNSLLDLSHPLISSCYVAFC